MISVAGGTEVVDAPQDLRSNGYAIFRNLLDESCIKLLRQLRDRVRVLREPRIEVSAI